MHRTTSIEWVHMTGQEKRRHGTGIKTLYRDRTSQKRRKLAIFQPSLPGPWNAID